MKIYLIGFQAELGDKTQLATLVFATTPTVRPDSRPCPGSAS